MSNPQERGWGPAGSGRMVRVPCAGIPLNVRAEVAPLFAALVARLDAARRAAGRTPLSSSGGYNLRPVRGYEAKYAATKNPDLLSNHSWGLAADFNAGTNPMGSPLRTDMPPETKTIAASLGLTHGSEWSRPDPMHLEFLGTPADAAREVAKLTAQEDDMFNDADRAALSALLKALPAINAANARVMGALDGAPSTALNDLDGAFLVKKLDAITITQTAILDRLNKLETKP